MNEFTQLSPAKQELLRKLLREKLASQSGRSTQGIPRRSERTFIPLSFAQQRLWFLDQLQPGLTTYNISCVVRLRGRLEIKALERSLQEIVRRHESLRTTF